jgi:hypothetical protein
VSLHKWYALKTRSAPNSGKIRFYAARNVKKADGKTTLILMHREIVGESGGLDVDHKDGDTLNNQRDNLRKCTRSENLANRRRILSSTGSKGVTRNGAKFSAAIRFRSRSYYLGTFKTVEEAAAAYDAGARILHKEFAATNAALKAAVR